MAIKYGNVYMFNIWQAEVTGITLNNGPLASGDIPAPVATTTPPYVPNQALAPKTNATEGQGAPGAFMCGKANPNSLVIQFDGENWNATLHIPDQEEGYPYDRNFFVYIAFQQLYVFDDNGVNITQPPDGGTFAPATP